MLESGLVEAVVARKLSVRKMLSVRGPVKSLSMHVWRVRARGRGQPNDALLQELPDHCEVQTAPRRALAVFVVRRSTGNRAVPAKMK